MNFQLRVPLDTSPEQHARLCALRAVFAQACNALAPQVQHSRVWNRVALHHLHYRALRAQFPQLGSQMVCNVIYAVSRTARLIYQHPDSPYNLARRGAQALPLLRFADSCPVYFDRHTLSLKPGQLSLYTLDGRMHFSLALAPERLALFGQAKLREVVLHERPDRVFELLFVLQPMQPLQPPEAAAPSVADGQAPEPADAGPHAFAVQQTLPDGDPGVLPQREPAADTTPIPDYVSVEDAP